VGHHYLDEFFRVVGARLEPHGVAGIQAITVPDHLYESHLREVDFIKRYIFPGSCIPSLAAMLRSAARTSDLRLVHMEDITRHYAKTLRLWRERFLSNVEKVRAMGFPERFVRMWEFYLAYCEGSFEERYNGDVQLVFAKPRCRSGLTGPPPAVGFPCDASGAQAPPRGSSR
jgi:cyclopropane-fatty-acyl-phospholipid synthase